jgi:hypothetical protein
VQAQREQAIQIMARRMGGANGDPMVFAEALRSSQLYDGERNREFFGTPENPGRIHRTAQHAIDIWSRLGELDIPLTPADVIRHDL